MTVIEKIVTHINKAFDANTSYIEGDTLPKDFVKAHTTKDGGLSLRIGCRDVQMRADGTWVGAGTNVEILKKYSLREQ